MGLDDFDLTDDLLQLFAEMLVGTVRCIIPFDLLSDEVSLTLDTISPIVMEYTILYKKIESEKEPWGWALKPDKICYNRKRLRWFLSGFEYGFSPPDMTFLIMIKITLHEMIHLAFPEYSEEKVEYLTDEWLNTFNWSNLKSEASES